MKLIFKLGRLIVRLKEALLLTAENTINGILRIKINYLHHENTILFVQQSGTNSLTSGITPLFTAAASTAGFDIIIAQLMSPINHVQREEVLSNLKIDNSFDLLPKGAILYYLVENNNNLELDQVSLNAVFVVDYLWKLVFTYSWRTTYNECSPIVF